MLAWRADRHVHALDGVVLHAFEIPAGLQRLRVASVVGRADAQLVIARPGCLPVEGPPPPRVRRRRRLDRRGRPALATVVAHLDLDDRAFAGPRATFDDVSPWIDVPRAGHEVGDAWGNHQRTRVHARDGHA